MYITACILLQNAKKFICKRLEFVEIYDNKLKE